MYQISSAFPIVLKLLLAMLCGGAVGFERELHRKAAGLRTNVLICMGATLYMIISRHIGGGAPYTDPARLAAQVVAGIGFLGAGVIIQARGSVHGLTTAATIFVVGAIGIAIGEGMFSIALLSTVLIILVLVVLMIVERRVVQRRRDFHYSLRTRDPADFLKKLLDRLDAEKVELEDFDVKDLANGEHEVVLSVTTSLDGHCRLLKRLPELGAEVRSSTQPHKN